MPTYDYRCDGCGTFEAFQGMTDKPLDTCPTCGGAVTRLISAGAGLLFKGSGFYITDHRTVEYEKSAKEDKPAPRQGSGPALSPAEGPAAAAPEGRPAGEAGKPAASEAPKAPSPSPGSAPPSAARKPPSSPPPASAA